MPMAASATLNARTPSSSGSRSLGSSPISSVFANVGRSEMTLLRPPNTSSL